VVQDAHVPVSSLHEKIEPDSLELKLKEALVEVVELDGPAAIVVLGAVRSIVHDQLPGVESTFPARSVARTRNVCAPAANPEYDIGLTHGA
jgi:hypothetical protein